jgi:hypothetical protein
VVPFGRLFYTLGGRIQSRSVALFGSYFVVIPYLVRNCFGSCICIHSESSLECFGSNIALVRHGLGSFGLSSLSSAFAGILEVRRMLGEHIVSDRGVHSLALPQVCLLIHL